MRSWRLSTNVQKRHRTQFRIRPNAVSSVVRRQKYWCPRETRSGALMLAGLIGKSMRRRNRGRGKWQTEFSQFEGMKLCETLVGERIKNKRFACLLLLLTQTRRTLCDPHNCRPSWWKDASWAYRCLCINVRLFACCTHQHAVWTLITCWLSTATTYKFRRRFGPASDSSVCFENNARRFECFLAVVFIKVSAT